MEYVLAIGGGALVYLAWRTSRERSHAVAVHEECLRRLDECQKIKNDNLDKQVSVFVAASEDALRAHGALHGNQF